MEGEEEGEEQPVTERANEVSHKVAYLNEEWPGGGR